MVMHIKSWVISDYTCTYQQTDRNRNGLANNFAFKPLMSAIIIIIVTTAWRLLRLRMDEMDLRDVGWDGMDWIDLAQDRDQWRILVNTVINLRVP
jgi:hypothetical protein